MTLDVPRCSAAWRSSSPPRTRSLALLMGRIVTLTVSPPREACVAIDRDTDVEGDSGHSTHLLPGTPTRAAFKLSHVSQPFRTIQPVASCPAWRGRGKAVTVPSSSTKAAHEDQPTSCQGLPRTDEAANGAKGEEGVADLVSRPIGPLHRRRKIISQAKTIMVAPAKQELDPQTSTGGRLCPLTFSSLKIRTLRLSGFRSIDPNGVRPIAKTKRRSRS